MLSPVICQLGPLQLRWYGLCAALAILAAYLLMARRAKRYGLDGNQAADILFLCVVAGLAGARLEYVRRFWSEVFADDPLAVFRVWEGGLVFQGGFILALAAVWIMCRIRRWRLGDVGDLMAVVLPVGHAISRMGCLLNGCCFGRPWNGFLSVTYPPAENDVLASQIANGFLPSGATASLPVFPVQALEALMCLAIAGVVLLLERRDLLRRQRFTVYMLLYALGRFAVEFLRGDYRQAAGTSFLTPAQLISVAIVLPLTAAVVAVSAWRSRRRFHAQPQPSKEQHVKKGK